MATAYATVIAWAAMIGIDEFTAVGVSFALLGIGGITLYVWWLARSSGPARRDWKDAPDWKARR